MKRNVIAEDGRRLSVRTRLVVFAGLAALLTPLSTALPAAPGSAASVAGQWTLRPGRTVNVSKMDISSCNVDFAFLLVFDASGRQIFSPTLGTNSGNTCSDVALSPPPYSYTNTSGQTETLKFRLDDTTCSSSFYDSDGGGPANHATASSSAVSINDGGAACQNEFVTAQPTKGHGNFNAVLRFK